MKQVPYVMTIQGQETYFPTKKAAKAAGRKARAEGQPAFIYSVDFYRQYVSPVPAN